MKSLKKVAVLPSATILTAIQMIDTNEVQAALVVDEANHLLGTITDGDVRRAILRGAQLSDPVGNIMNRRPTVAKLGDGRGKILEVMKQKQIHQIPILDKAGRLVGVEVLDELIKSSVRDNWVILMAGGEGNRLRPLTNNQPKPLLNVGNKPILETILESFIEYGFKRFYISVNYKNEMIKEYFGNGSRWNVKIFYLHEDERLGTAGALNLLPEKPTQSFFVMNGDLLTKVNLNQLLHFHLQNKALATMCVREYDFQVPYGVVELRKHYIRNVDEKPVHRFFVNAGIYVLEPEVLKHVKKKKRFDMPDLFERLISQGVDVTAFPIREYWLDVGRIDDLERAKGEFSKIFL